MILNSMKLKNVKCYDEAEVSFIQGKNVIIGRNGSGKSTLLQSILYSMYAYYPRGNNDQLIRTGASAAEFELEFSQSGTEYLVERKLRAKGSPEAYLTEKESDLLKAETQTGVTDEIADLVKTKKEVFQDVILVRQGEIARIIDKRPSERKELFDRLLGLHDYEQAYRNCAGIKSILANKVEESKKVIGAYEGSAAKLEERKTSLSKLKEALGESSKQEKGLSAQLQDVDRTWNGFQELSRAVDKLESSIEIQERSLEEERESAEELEESIAELCADVQIRIPKTLTAASLGKMIQEAESKNSSLSTAVERTLAVKTKLDKLSEREKSIEKQSAGLDKDLQKNESEARREGGEDWRETAAQDPKDLEAQTKKASKEAQDAQTKYENLSKAAARSEAEVKRLQKSLDNLTKLVGKKCPTCGQIVSDEHAQELRQSIEDDLTQAKKTLKKQEELAKEAKKDANQFGGDEKALNNQLGLTKRLRIYLESERKLHKRQQDVAAERGEIQGEIDATTEEVASIDELGLPKSKFTKLSLESKAVELKSHSESLQNRVGSLVSLKSEAGSLASLLGTIRDHETSLENDIKELLALKKEYDEERHVKLTQEREGLKDELATTRERMRILKEDRIPEAATLLDESKDAADKIRSIESEQKAAADALEVLEKVRGFYREVQRPLRRRDLRRASREASEIFRTLMGSNEFERIEITEDHDLQISRLGVLEPMSMLSGGEQVLASLSVRLGFARALASSDLLILDEPTAFLDEQRRAELVDTLYRVSPAKQMLIVTHDDEFHKVAQRVIHVEKDDITLKSRISWDE